MTLDSSRVDALRAPLDEMAAATDRLLASVDTLDDDSLRGPSLLPGWTRAHVCTHLARNADGFVNLVLSACTGEPRPMYAGGKEGRDAEIAAGVDRQIGDVRLDLAETAERLLESFADFPAEALDRVVTLASGATGTGREIPLLRVREVEIHHVDLDAGYTPDDWSPEFAARTLDQLSPFFAGSRECPVGTLVATDAEGRWEVAAEGPELTGSATDLAAWLTGRASGGRLAVAGQTQVPPAPRWV